MALWALDHIYSYANHCPVDLDGAKPVPGDFSLVLFLNMRAARLSKRGPSFCFPLGRM